MVYETDFYTTRRPYRATPSLSTYTITSEPSRQVRLLPGLGKVHVVHTYDRIVPYVGHKKLTVVTSPPLVVRVRPSTLYRELDHIEHKLRPISYRSYTNDYLNSQSAVRIVYTRNPISSSYPAYKPSILYSTRYYPTYASYNYYPTYLSDFASYYSYPYYISRYYPYVPTPTTRFYSTYSFYPSYRWNDLALLPSWRYNQYARMFDDETRLIKAQTASLLQRIHNPVPRKVRSLPLPYVSRYEEVPARIANDNYIHRLLISSPSNKSDYSLYYSDPVKKYFGSQGKLSCVTFAGEKNHLRRRNVYTWDDPVKNDIQLLSYYISRGREQRAAKMVSKVPRQLEDPALSEEMKQLKEERAARLAKISIVEDNLPLRSKEDRAADKAKAEAAAKKEAEAAAKKEAEAKKAKKEAEAAAKREAEAAAAAVAAKKAAEDAEAKAKEEAEAKAKQEAARKEKEAKDAAEKAAELERQAEQARQEELAKQAEIEKAKQEEEERLRVEEEKRLAEEAKAEEERQQLLRLEEIARQAEEEKEAELARQAEELAELARQEAELAELAKKEEEAVEEERKAAEQADLEKKQQELEELETKEKELTELAEQARAEADEARIEADVAEQQAASAEEEPVGDETAAEEPVVEEPADVAEDEVAAEADVAAEESIVVEDETEE